MVNNPSGNNPQSGRSIGLPDVETYVSFVQPFGSIPHVVISAWDKKEVWLTEVTTIAFKWMNSAKNAITIDWIADEE